MARLTLKNSLCTIVLLLAVTFCGYAAESRSQNEIKPFITIPDKRVFGYGTFVDLYIPFGIGYVANISTDMTRMEQLYALHVPIGLCVDTRFIAWFSIFSGVEFLYELQSFRQNPQNEEDPTIRHFYHNLQLEIPIVVKFYPFVSKGDQYENMYFGVGLLAHFSPARFYSINDGDGIAYGNVYTDANEAMIPSAAYPPANVGLRLAMGNTFMFRDKAGFGLELYLNYLFVPTICGYWSDPNYIIKDDPFLDFNLTVGIAFSIAIRAYSSLRE